MGWKDYKEAIQLAINGYQDVKEGKLQPEVSDVRNEEDEVKSDIEKRLKPKDIKDAKADAKFRKDNAEAQKQQPVSISVEINEDGQVTFSFDREIVWPSYMLTLLKQEQN